MTYLHPNLARAKCTAQAGQTDGLLCCALNIELPANGDVPEWVHVLPIGPQIEGRDGRHWVMYDAQVVIDRSYASGRDIVGDYEHASEIKAPKGEKAPAAFWVKQLQVRADGIWARVEWTDSGRRHVAAKEYRYISPVFTYNKTTLEIYAITSIGLTNKHNLFLTALNQAAQPAFAHHHPTEDAPVKLPEAIRQALKLKEDATEQDAVTAITALNTDLTTAKNAQQQPSLEQYVPRADYETAMNRAQTAEAELSTHLATAKNAEITALVEQAIDDGKIAPVSKGFYITACNQENGVEQFKKFIESAPAIAGGESDLDGKAPGTGAPAALNQQQQAMAAVFGNSADDLAQYGG